MRRRYQTRTAAQEPPDIHLVETRVSTDEQVERGNSLEEQADWGLDDAGREAPNAPVSVLRAGDGGVLDGEVPPRDGQAHIVLVAEEGLTSSILERPGLDLVRELIRSGRVISVRATRIDRVSRNVGHQQLFLSEVARYKVRLKLRDFGEYRGDDPIQHAMLTNLGTWAQLERALVRERTMAGKRKRAAKGQLTHWPGTYGLAYDKESKTVALDASPAVPGRPEMGSKADIVRQMYVWVLEWDDASFHGIARRLNELGVPSPRGSTWAKATVRRILTNTAYRGVIYIQRHNAAGVKFNKLRPPEERLSRSIRPREEWREVHIPALLDEVTWERVQQRLGTFRRRRSGATQGEYLLSGLCVCGRCQSTVHGNLITQPASGRKHRYYVCTAKSPGIAGVERCASPFLRADQLEELVWQTVRTWILDPAALEQVMRQAVSDSNGPARELRLAEEAIAAAKDEEAEILDLRRRRLLTRETAEGQLAQLQSRIGSLARRASQLRAQSEAAASSTRTRDGLAAFVADVRDRIDTLGFADRQAVIRRLVSEVVTDSPDVRVVINATGLA